MDKVSKEVRSKIMSKIRSTNTTPELLLREALEGSYMRYQPKIEGKPDFANKTKRVAVFVDGCFWHKCPKCFRPPKSNKKYWRPKIDRNVEKDKKTTMILEKQGWMVLRFWEHEVFQDADACAKKVIENLNDR